VTSLETISNDNDTILYVQETEETKVLFANDNTRIIM